MTKRIDITSFLYTLLMIIVFACGTAFSQEFVSSDNFKNKIAKDIVVVEFWAGWNSTNECAWLPKLNECEVYRVDIGKYIDIQTKYNISAIPTLIVFNNGNIEEQFDPNIMFQLEATKSDVQNTIDEIMLKQFE